MNIIMLITLFGLKCYANDIWGHTIVEKDEQRIFVDLLAWLTLVHWKYSGINLQDTQCILYISMSKLLCALFICWINYNKAKFTYNSSDLKFIL